MRELFRQHPIGLTFVALTLLALLIFIGPSACHKVSDSVWHKGTTKDEQAIKADEAEAQKWKKVADEALGRLEETKRALAEETAKREAAEKILADRHTSTKAAQDAYDRAVAAAPVPVDPNASSDDLCERARRLGVDCPR